MCVCVCVTTRGWLVCVYRIKIFSFFCGLNAEIQFFFFAECSAKLVDLALESGKIYEGEGFKYIKECFENGTLHLIGLLSDGGVHSRLDQLQVGFIVEDSNFFLINLYAG
jgi:hypothetical protein